MPREDYIGLSLSLVTGGGKGMRLKKCKRERHTKPSRQKNQGGLKNNHTAPTPIGESDKSKTRWRREKTKHATPDRNQEEFGLKHGGYVV